MDYLLDTNILLAYLKKSKYSSQIDNRYSPLSLKNTPIISVVSLGEIQSICIQNNWGKIKVEKLNELLNKFIVADINVKTIIERYAEIDSFSQGKLQTKPSKFTSRNMGKNDLWIAATAFALNCKLLTTDKDFSHLDKEFIDLELVALAN